MELSDIAELRLVSHGISPVPKGKTADVVSRLGALQGQDYFGTKWSIGLRLTNSTDDEIETAISEKKIVRSWPLRGTLHFADAKDIRWMCGLLGPRLIANNKKRYEELELDSSVFKKCNQLMIRELKGNRSLTRDELTSLFSKNGIDATKNRLSFILQRAGLDQILCFGERRGKEFTYVLLDEWIPDPGLSFKTPELASAELARRYFQSRGPATLYDYVWWSGMSVTDARKSVESIESELKSVTIGDPVYWMPKNLKSRKNPDETVYLLPGFDEFLLGYTDRSASIDVAYQKRMIPANGVFSSTIVVRGKVLGTWKRTIQKKNEVLIEITPFAKPNKDLKNGISEAANRYASFLGMSPNLVFKSK
ncbi:winged helix DNA-binding domain-containing protein [Leptospira yasudae]|uniref:Winged helix DNA-binding domain-containing protein n=1 Tax=Leptospira yasudae TaxID=2202201 RepID=A0A6N4QXB7_9LEPT|nr:winged helix DNA-binding domain-containing protein [Leptospira yasudae]TGL76747.1 winged helix DNA-binding domain-containing protein [Leptospira yasudae]TGL82034.1 winged helix DNA-binding domain-containing protein [Leptospira yasudae]TGL84180.1 winged helix DNA-binding domain-containing protein [Leptospira yasudae]